MSSNNSSWQLVPSVYLDGYLRASHSICVSFGIPFNLCLAITIVYSERLHSQRNFNWLGTGFANVFVLVYHLMELLALEWPDSIASWICAWISGLPYPNLLVSYFFSSIERHLCLRCPAWYKRHVTNGWIITGQVGCLTILSLIIKGRHIFGASERQWKWTSFEFDLLFSFVLAGLVLCLIGQFAIWNTSCRSHPSVAGIRYPPLMYWGREFNPFVRIGEERISRLDLEAARTMSVISIILICILAPAVVTFFHLSGCLGADGILSEEDAANCSGWAQLMYYQREFVVVHCAFLSPAFFAVGNNNIRIAFRDAWTK